MTFPYYAYSGTDLVGARFLFENIVTNVNHLFISFKNLLTHLLTKAKTCFAIASCRNEVETTPQAPAGGRAGWY